MIKSNLLLLKTLLRSTSLTNIFRYTKDAKKRRRIVISIIGLMLLYAMLVVYSVLMCIGYGSVGLASSIPVMCALAVSAIAFFFTIFKTNGYLFNFKEYDMLMALPFKVGSVAASRFLYMYVKSLPWYLSISVAMMIGYGIFARPAVPVYILWILLSFFLPIIPMLAASFLGSLIARVSAGFRKTNLIQTILMFVFMLLCFSLRFIIENLFRDDRVETTLENASQATARAAEIYFPAGWFSNAIQRSSLSVSLLLIGVSAGLFIVVFYAVGRSYRQINSALKSHAASRSYRMSGQKKRSVVRAIAFKEFRRMTGSTVYMTNCMFGMIFAVLLGIIALIFGPERIIGVVTQGAPLDAAMLRPAIPFIVYFFTGMLASTACSPSLEGKNYWIVQSLPIAKTTLYQGKMLFQMILSVPCMLFAVLCLCVSMRTPILHTILYMLLGVLLCTFSSTWGCVCGIRHMRLDWENEVEVIKQGAAVTIYLLPNLFVVMGLVVLLVFLGTRMDHAALAGIMIVIAGVLSLISYRRAMTLAQNT